MPLYNGQSPLQLGLSGLKPDQDSGTICLAVYQCVVSYWNDTFLFPCVRRVRWLRETEALSNEDRQVKDASDS